MSACACVLALAAPSTRADEFRHRFDFGAADAVQPGFTPVDETAVFSAARGYGFESGSSVRLVDRGGSDALRRDFLTTEASLLFSIVVPREGNYRVTVVLGDPDGESATTIQAELRRLMLEQVRTRPRGHLVRRFIVNTRTPAIDGARAVRLKERETTYEARAWDDRITLEMSDPRMAVCSLEVEPADEVPTLFLLGDSTMTDQARGPYGGWGQMVTRFLDDTVAVANHGESGESYASALAESRVDKVLQVLRPGDYVAMQFGHNDQKAAGEGAGAFAGYVGDVRRCVLAVRQRRGIPILVTSMHRNVFDTSGRVVNTLGDYPEAVRRVAAELNVPLIDLHARSAVLYEAYGPERAGALFVAGDTTHPNLFGAYQLARCVIAGLRDARLPLATAVAPDFEPFDPTRPDDPAQFHVSVDPTPTASRPEGS